MDENQRKCPISTWASEASYSLMILALKEKCILVTPFDRKSKVQIVREETFRSNFQTLCTLPRLWSIRHATTMPKWLVFTLKEQGKKGVRENEPKKYRQRGQLNFLFCFQRRMKRSSTCGHSHSSSTAEGVSASQQFVIGGNEFLIIETDNVLWHLEQCRWRMVQQLLCS